MLKDFDLQPKPQPQQLLGNGRSSEAVKKARMKGRRKKNTLLSTAGESILLYSNGFCNFSFLSSWQGYTLFFFSWILLTSSRSPRVGVEGWWVLCRPHLPFARMYVCMYVHTIQYVVHRRRYRQRTDDAVGPQEQGPARS